MNQILLLLKAARFLGGDNLFRRSVHNNGSELINLGYSITFFDQPLSPQDLNSVEYTWSYDAYQLRYPSRARILEKDQSGEGGKRTYYLSDIQLGSDGQSATFVHLDRFKNQLDLIWDHPHPRSTARWT